MAGLDLSAGAERVDLSEGAEPLDLSAGAKLLDLSEGAEPIDVATPEPIAANPATTEPDADYGDFLNSFLKSAGSQNVDLSAHTFGALSDLQGGTQFDADVDEMLKWGNDLKKGIKKPKFERVQDALGSPGDFVDWAQSAAGDALGTMIIPMVGGIAGGAIGGRAGKVGGTAGAMGGAFTGSMLLNIGSMRQTLIEEGVTDRKQRGKWSMIGGSVLSSLDSMLPGQQSAKLTGPMRDDLKKAIARRLISEAWKGAAKEGVTEGLQEGTEELLGKYVSGNPVDLNVLADKMINGAAAGAVGGGAMSTGTEAVKSTAEALTSNRAAKGDLETDPNRGRGLPAPDTIYQPGPESDITDMSAVQQPKPTVTEAGRPTSPVELNDAATQPPIAEPRRIPPPGPRPEQVAQQDVATLIDAGVPQDIVEEMNSAERAQMAQEAREAGVSGRAAPEDAQNAAEGPDLSDGAVPIGDQSAPAPAEAIEQVREQVNTEPTDAQKEAGNYKKGHIKWNGLDISIENPKGSERSGTGADGRPWSVQMPADYGYIKRTKGADGDHVDIYFGDNPESDKVFIIDQQDADTRKFDEHKVILGANNTGEAISLYNSAFSDERGYDRIGGVKMVTVDEFKTWLKGDTTKPAEATNEPTRSDSTDISPESGSPDGVQTRDGQRSVSNDARPQSDAGTSRQVSEQLADVPVGPAAGSVGPESGGPSEVETAGTGVQSGGQASDGEDGQTQDRDPRQAPADAPTDTAGTDDAGTIGAVGEPASPAKTQDNEGAAGEIRAEEPQTEPVADEGASAEVEADTRTAEDYQKEAVRGAIDVGQGRVDAMQKLIDDGATNAQIMKEFREKTGSTASGRSLDRGTVQARDNSIEVLRPGEDGKPVRETIKGKELVELIRKAFPKSEAESEATKADYEFSTDKTSARASLRKVGGLWSYDYEIKRGDFTDTNERPHMKDYFTNELDARYSALLTFANRSKDDALSDWARSQLPKGDGPWPNENGVYSADPSKTLTVQLGKGKSAAAKRIQATIEMVQTRDGGWLSSIDYHLQEQGGGGPLTVNSRKQDGPLTRKQALIEAIDDLATRLEGSMKGTRPQAQIEAAQRGLDWLRRLADKEGIDFVEIEGKIDEATDAKPKPVQPEPSAAPSGQTSRKTPPKGSGAPKTITAFLKSLGGIKEEKGELGARNLTKQRPGLVNNKSGMSLEEALERAVEAGYLIDEGALSGTASTVDQNSLLELIDEDIAGNARYPIGQEPEAAQAVDNRTSEDIARSLFAEDDMAFVEEMRIDLNVLDPADVERVAELVNDGENFDNALERAIIEAELKSVGRVEGYDNADDIKATFDGFPEAPAAGPENERTGLSQADERRDEAESAGKTGQEAGDGQAEDVGPDGKAQTVIPGAEKITDKEQAERAADKPMRADAVQQEPGGLFGDDRNQTDIMDLISAPSNVEENIIEVAVNNAIEQAFSSDKPLMIGTGDILKSRSGRQLSPAPKIDGTGPRKTLNTIKRMDEWLKKEAIIELRERDNNDFGARQVEMIDLNNISQSDRDVINTTLWDDYNATIRNLVKRGDEKRTKTQVAKSAGRNLAKGVVQAAEGLNALFNDPNKLGSGPVFDEETYQKALPFFRQSAASFYEAGKDIGQLALDLVNSLIDAGLTRQAVENMKPYLTRFIGDVESGTESLDASGTRGDLEPDSGPTTAEDGLGTTGVPASSTGDGLGTGEGRGAVDPETQGPASGGGVSSGDAIVDGESRHLELRHEQPEHEGGAPLGPEQGGSVDTGVEGLPAERIPTETVAKSSTDRSSLAEKRKAQKAAESLPHVDSDLENIRATLPVLFPKQQEDVLKIEQRFAKPDGHGMLITNGTGTGKTYTGLGVMKRFARLGKTSQLLIAPSQGILTNWVKSARDLGMNINVLGSKSDNGKGITATTYANLGDNPTLADRDWDLVLPDESHKLSSEKSGRETSALKVFRAVTMHPRGLRDRARFQLRKEVEKVDALRVKLDAAQKAKPRNEALASRLDDEYTDLVADLEAKIAEKLAQWENQPRTKALFLSATPFAYPFSLDYAEGYLFDYPGSGGEGYNAGSARDQFYMQNFGYRMRYNKLTRPEADVNSEIMEREFHEKLKKSGALSGRVLDVDHDYDRKFVLVDSAIGKQIDNVMDFLMQADNGRFRPLHDVISKKFDYLSRMRLLEAIKAREAGDFLQQHLDLGRKAVVFHDYNEGGGFNPFVLNISEDAVISKILSDGTISVEKVQELYNEFVARNPEIREMKFSDYLPPIDELSKRFGSKVGIYNGRVSNKDRKAALDKFNQDGSGLDILVVQSAAGEFGISMHDVSGVHQRLMLNLGMPIRPTSALQQEGRVYREGQMSDAMFRYMNTGTTWERITFASKIAERAGTAENLALGNQARTIRQSFVDAFTDSDSYPAEPGEGKGGKELDRSMNESISEFERAKTHYFAQAKKRGRRDQREGIDYFATPEPVGLKMVELANIRPGEKILEPSAGHGAISRYFPENTERTIVEPSLELSSKAALVTPGARTVVDTFENFSIVNKYDAVVMNPPFGSGGRTAIDHLAKAVKHLRIGGRVVALLPTGPAADKKFDAFYEEVEGVSMVADIKLPQVTFERAGTKVMGRIVVLQKDVPGLETGTQTSTRDYTSAEKIGELFDRIEDLEISNRPDVSALTDESTVTIDGILWEFETNDQGTRSSAKPRDFLGRERFAEAARLATQVNGRYSQILRTFEFPSVEQMYHFQRLLAEPKPERPAQDTPQDVGFNLHKTVHTKTGKTVYMAELQERVERDEYVRLNDLAKENGGYYSRYKGQGAVPGFLFRSEQDRSNFLAIAAPGQPGADAAPQAAIPAPAGPSLSSRRGKEIARKVLQASHQVLGRELRLGLVDEIAADPTWQGAYDPAERAAFVAIKVSTNPMRTLGHESIHGLRDIGVITKPEWSALSRLAQSQWIEEFNIRERYRDLQETRGWSDEKFEEIVTEEAVADAFGHWFSDRQSRPLGRIEGVFERIKAFFASVANLLTQGEFQSALSVFRNIESGKVARRRTGPTQSAYTTQVAAQLPNEPQEAPQATFDPPVSSAAEAFNNQAWGRLKQTKEALGAAILPARRKLQDRFIDLKRVQEAIREQIGDRINDLNDVYQRETLYYGRAGQRLEEFGRKHVDPLIEEMLVRKISQDELDLYLTARHAEERNARIAEINPSMPDGGSGMTNAEAAQVMVDFGPKLADLEVLARQVDQIISDTRVRLLRNGLISEDEFNSWSTQYSNYVPLKGFEADKEGAAEERTLRTGRKYDVRGKESFQALGRKSRSDSPLVYLISDANRSIIRAEKNRVAKAFLQLVRDNPNKQMWEIKQTDRTRKLVTDPITGLQVVKDTIDPFYRLKDEVFSVKVNGRPILIEIKHKGVAAAMKGLGTENMNGIVRGLHVIQRALAAINTSLNPEFIFTNLSRDLQTAAINLQKEEIKGLTAAMLRDVPMAMSGIYGDKFTNSDTAWKRHYTEFSKAGGKVGFFGLGSIEDQRKAIQKKIAEFNDLSFSRAPIRGAKYALQLIMDMNEVVENAARLSAFKNLRERGYSPDQAAMVAKELTVNFNRKGDWGPVINSFYLFYNAGLQGSVIMLQRLAQSKNVRRAAYGIGAFGLAMGVLNRHMLADDDDDGKNEYDKIPFHEKERNIIIMIPKAFRTEDGPTYLKFPMPYGYNTFYVIGEQTAAGISGAIDPMEVAGNILSSGANSFNPLGTSNSFIHMLTPTLLKPVQEIDRNENTFGYPIMPSDFPNSVPTPDSQKAWSSVNPALKEVAETMNRMTGGNEFRPGYIDVSPETLEHMIEFSTGGVGKFILRTEKTISAINNNEDLEANDVPLLRRFVGKKSRYVDRSLYYDMRDDVRLVEKEYRGQHGKGRSKEAQQVQRDYPVEFRMIGAVKTAEKQLRKIRKQAKQAKEQGAGNDSEVIKGLQEQQDKVMTQARTRYYRLQETLNR